MKKHRNRSGECMGQAVSGVEWNGGAQHRSPELQSKFLK